jgi:hypothetical protein
MSNHFQRFYENAMVQSLLQLSNFIKDHGGNRSGSLPRNHFKLGSNVLAYESLLLCAQHLQPLSIESILHDHASSVQYIQNILRTPFRLLDRNQWALTINLASQAGFALSAMIDKILAVARWDIRLTVCSMAIILNQEHNTSGVLQRFLIGATFKKFLKVLFESLDCMKLCLRVDLWSAEPPLLREVTLGRWKCGIGAWLIEPIIMDYHSTDWICLHEDHNINL